MIDHDSIPLVLIWMFALFQIKHLVIDFFFQTPVQYLNKGKYGHFGGILHALLHMWGTLAVLYLTCSSFVPVTVGLALSLVDAVAHYHIDWAKVNINKRFGLTPTTSEVFWWLVGVDQFLHQATYIGIIAYVTRFF